MSRKRKPTNGKSRCSTALHLRGDSPVLELAIVIEARLGEAGAAELDLWLYKVGVEIVAVDAEQIAVATRAWRSPGKGRHPAGLNYGDCFSYALAKTRDEPLLFIGDDFSRTDIEAA